MPKRWRIHAHDPDGIAALQRSAGVPAVVAQLLLCRGTRDGEAARIFLDPKLSALRDPELLPGCAPAAARVWQAIRAGEKIVVYGDYDVDGITATAILWRCLRMLGANVGHYLPNRIDEGYGLHCDALTGIAADGARLIVTVDCGISSVREIAHARGLGMDVVLTDHHEPGPELPAAAAIVHPRVPAGAYPFGDLSGAGVALKLAWAICQEASGAKKVSPQMRDFLVSAVGLASLGTVADVVPLVDENRVLVRHGLEGIAKQPTLGLAALIEAAGLNQQKCLSSQDVAFGLAPRLNAAGRLGQPQLALELLLTDRPERARELAQYINGLNESRQKLDRSILLAATKQIKEQFDIDREPALVLADREWHPGIIGIVAGRLAERHHRPVIIIAWDKLGTKPGVGSARSIPGFDIRGALAECGDFLVSYGGHAAAAGLKIEESQLPAFRAALCDVAAARITEQQRIAELFIDAEAPLSAFTPAIIEQIERLAPFGEGNCAPVMCATGVTLAEPPRTMGEGGAHLAVQLSQHGTTMRAVAFRCGEWSQQLSELGGPFDVAFQPTINNYRGRRSVELRLVDWRPGEK